MVGLSLVLAAATASDFGTMRPSQIRNLLKKTYCEEMRGQRVYNQEKLETDCVEKVQIFDNNVSKLTFLKRVSFFTFASLDFLPTSLS